MNIYRHGNVVKTIILKCKRLIHYSVCQELTFYNIVRKKYTKDFDRNLKLKPNTASVQIIGRANVTPLSINVPS